jgi:hypothetical protein
MIGCVMNVKMLVEWELAGRNGDARENHPWCNFVHHKSHVTWDRIRTPSPVGIRRLTVWNMARILIFLNFLYKLLDRTKYSLGLYKMNMSDLLPNSGNIHISVGLNTDVWLHLFQRDIRSTAKKIWKVTKFWTVKYNCIAPCMHDPTEWPYLVENLVGNTEFKTSCRTISD